MAYQYRGARMASDDEARTIAKFRYFRDAEATIDAGPAPYTPAPDSRCGTYSGYVMHRRRGEIADQACREANAAHQRDYRKRRAEAA